MNIKRKICEQLIQSGKLKPFYVVEHSYTDGGGRMLENLIVSTDGIFPCLTTRPDTLGVVIDEER